MSRARQNVIFEMGLFYGLVGRQNVIALDKGVKDLPSDIGGVIPIFFSEKEDWKPKLVREVKVILKSKL